MFKESINRYLGYVLTLVTEYEEKLFREIVVIDGMKVGSGKGKKSSEKSIDGVGSDREVRSEEGSNKNLDDLSVSRLRGLEKSQKMSQM